MAAILKTEREKCLGSDCITIEKHWQWDSHLCSKVPASAHPFFGAGSTQAAKKAVDHLNATENHLQAACGQQSTKQPNVKVHNVTRLCAFPPPWTVSQVTWVTMQWRKKEVYEWPTIRKPSKCQQRDIHVCHLSLKGIVQSTTVLQRGPLCKPSTATIKLYKAPATPTAANAIDKNICSSTRKCQSMFTLSLLYQTLFFQTI